MKARTMITIALLTICVAPAAVGTARKGGGKMEELKIASPAFADRGNIPAKYTCDGSDVNPPLTIQNVPAGTKSLALIMDDPDAPSGMWVHWLVWNINPATREIAENTVSRESISGKNDWHRNSYGGPCPPSGTHRYFIKLYALDATLALSGASTKSDLEKAMEGHILAEAQLLGLYKKRH